MDQAAELSAQAAAALIDRAERIVVAGISTDSGIPDFRGPNGVWTRNPEAEKQSTSSYYLSTPRCAPAWRDRVDDQAWTAEPNAGHQALRRPRARGEADVLVTQNIDGLHHAGRAATPIGSSRSTGRCVRRVPDVRLTRPDARDARPGPGRRGRPAVRDLRRDPEVGDDLVRTELVERTSTGLDAAADARPDAGGRDRPCRCSHRSNVVPIAARPAQRGDRERRAHRDGPAGARGGPRIDLRQVLPTICGRRESGNCCLPDWVVDR